jgi:undecaprenyl-diphosphatase
LNIIEVLKAVLFGVVEGITEWLPISSTGHLIILENLLDVKDIYGSGYWNLFLVVVQLGAILAVVALFFSELSPIKKDKKERESIYRLWIKIIIAIIPSVILGLLLDDFIESKLYNAVGVSTALIFYGIVFILIESINKKEKINNVDDIGFSHAFIIGLFQALAIIPGTSRSGITIIGAMLLSCNRSASAKFSFYLSIPTMLGASILKLIKFYLSGYILDNLGIYFMLIGAVTACLVSLIVIRLLMSYINKNSFKIFGYYRIVLGIIILIMYLNNII